jgi:mono/diheme cytochrome c family protein
LFVPRYFSTFLLIYLFSAACGGPDVSHDATTQKRVDRGSYLINAVMACDNCHTPRGRNGLDMQRRFSGGSEVWDTREYTVRGSNITPDRATGIGSWSDNDLKRLLTEGMRPNGVRVAPQMPYRMYEVLTPSDLDAVVAYVRNVSPVRNKIPAPVYKTSTYAGPTISSAPEQQADDPVPRGAYLASLAYCMACHSRRPDGVVDVQHWQGRGGFKMKGGFGAVTVPNITSDREKGVGAWTDAELRRALTEGVDRDGRTFSLPMARQAYYRQMTQDDLNALIAWLRTIRPAK